MNVRSRVWKCNTSYTNTTALKFKLKCRGIRQRFTLIISLCFYEESLIKLNPEMILNYNMNLTNASLVPYTSFRGDFILHFVIRIHFHTKTFYREGRYINSAVFNFEVLWKRKGNVNTVQKEASIHDNPNISSFMNYSCFMTVLKFAHDRKWILNKKNWRLSFFAIKYQTITLLETVFLQDNTPST